MFLKLLGILFTTLATLALAVFFGIALVLVLRFWFIALIVVIFLSILYSVARAVGLQINFRPQPITDKDNQYGIPTTQPIL